MKPVKLERWDPERLARAVERFEATEFSVRHDQDVDARAELRSRFERGRTTFETDR